MHVGRSRHMERREVIEFQCPDREEVHEIVGQYLKKMSHDTAPGLDNIPAAFIKYAHVCGSESPRKYKHVLHPVLSDWFYLCLKDGITPSDWKVAKVSPIYKKDAVLDPNNYRMIAVSGVLYRLYTNVMREVVTRWCEKYKKVPDCQFGFYPGRNTCQPMFVLRHAIHAASHKNGPGGSPKLFSAFIDFKQAYDPLDRQALWRHFNQRGITPRSSFTCCSPDHSGPVHHLAGEFPLAVAARQQGRRCHAHR